ncbi:outer membrane beta-barrel protein [Marinigracilibium pacificum]|uniref:Outer membrane beta-barrel protein n=1 Tax=Marinigracilibium pacificum TaxID=2729599 RepID=A0A848J5Z8_9BACT|nr:outer membrane beta-barrel protein [Marinigracilibium pacificum]NMM49894.1 outer membrane beta-barrel protein [Marinigracilibium pacificum]
MNKHFFIVIISILTFSYANAQDNYLPAVIVSLQGDTISGKIDYKNWGSNPDKINFYNENKRTIYKPFEIKSFLVNDELYQSAIVQVDNSTYDLGNLSDSPNPVSVTDTVFVRKIIEGKRDLFYFKTKSGIINLYIDNGGKIEWLERKKYYYSNNGSKQVIENSKYKNQLSLYFNDCDDIHGSIVNSSYTLKSLTKLFIKYNECHNQEVIVFSKEEKIITKFSILSGLSQTTLTFNSSLDNYAYLVEPGKQNSIDFIFGFAADILLPRNNQRWIIHNELLLSTYSVSFEHENVMNENRTITNKSTIGNTSLALNVLLRHKIPVGNVDIFINGGFSAGLSIKNENFSITEDTFYIPVQTTEGVAINPIRTGERGFTGGLGLSIKNVNIEARYLRSIGPSVIKDLDSNIQKMNLILSYEL